MLPTPFRRPLTPEEESIGDPDDEDETAIDDTLPADLWFRARRRTPRTPSVPRPGGAP